MTSLPLPLASATPSSRSRPVFAMPSYFITHAKRSNRLRVSCTDAGNKKETSRNVETPLGKVDRRNMLLGLGGGLYGAANLISSPGASAEPVSPPQLDKCGYSTYNTLKGQPAAHNLTPEYIYKYNKAIECMKKQKDNPNDPRGFMQQANIHCAYCNGAYTYPTESGQNPFTLQVHNSWLFFPFHRWYLYFYERILGKLIDDPTFALPFWNWDNPKGMYIPEFFLDSNSALCNSKRNPDNLKAVVDLGFTGNKNPDQVVSNNLSIMYNEMVTGNADAYGFMGKPYCQGSNQKDTGPGSVERGSHTAVHVFVGDPREPAGEDLGNFYSAGRDPLFFCHHSNVDRMWTLWQYYLPSAQIPDKRILSDNFQASFLFYDENAQLVRVKVEDCLDNRCMGYDFEQCDLPWLDYRPPAQTAKAKVIKTRKTAQNAETVFPLNLDKIVRVLVPKTKKGKADELLVIENITVDTTKFLKFDVFVNDEDDDLTELDKAAYAGTYAQVPHKSGKKTNTTSISLKLTDLYKRMDVEDDDTVLVTLVPRHQGEGVTIGGIKIIENPTPVKPANS
ncbi:UNVERIFIED_CONTAM: Polyphenol oxidase II, chloroplastic [Sesamum latifolium]|uniref:Polyphenol oxidase II, chloroplastic n=1 Tax=Sesamum latifolium TaxID=2727402 RepID=A0AAW2TP12_9LAMI